MSYSIYTVPPFDRQFQRLAKKFPSIKKDFIDFLHALKERPEQGTALGNNCYKIYKTYTKHSVTRIFQ
jgi:mRNA-degrading endonuclease RelE of RelBE toxin-antitoxin system